MSDIERRVCEACGHVVAKFGALVAHDECDGDCGCLELQLEAKCKTISRLEAERALLVAAVEAADHMLTQFICSCGECHRVRDPFLQARAALDAQGAT